MSLLMMTFGLTPLGTMPLSAAAEAWGAPVAVAIGSGVTLVSASLFFLLSKSLRSIDDAARAALDESAHATRPPATVPAPAELAPAKSPAA